VFPDRDERDITVPAVSSECLIPCAAVFVDGIILRKAGRASVPVATLNFDKSRADAKVNHIVLDRVLALVGNVPRFEEVGNYVLYLACALVVLAEPFNRTLVSAVPFGVAITIAELTLITATALELLHRLFAVSARDELGRSEPARHGLALTNQAAFTRTGKEIIARREHAKRFTADRTRLVNLTVFPSVVLGSGDDRALDRTRLSDMGLARLAECLTAYHALALDYLGMRRAFANPAIGARSASLPIMPTFFGAEPFAVYQGGGGRNLLSALLALYNDGRGGISRALARAIAFVLGRRCVVSGSTPLTDFEHKKTSRQVLAFLTEGNTDLTGGRNEHMPLTPTVKRYFPQYAYYSTGMRQL
jgi:hypothetical protein